MSIVVSEVTMALPDMIRVEVLDPPIVRGAYVDFSASPVSGSYNTWGTFPDPTQGANNLGWPMGLRDPVTGKCNFVRFRDNYNTTWFNRSAAKVPGDYGLSSSGSSAAPSITDVFYHCELADSGFWTCPDTANGSQSVTASVQFRHWLYLKLDSNLISRGGPYTISFPSGTGLSDYVLDFDDRKTRACSILGTHIGHRVSDELKLGYWACKVVGYSSPAGEGMCHLPTDYGITTFDIINAVGSPIVEGLPIGSPRALPTDPEASALWSSDPAGPNLQTYPSSTLASLDVQSITIANPCVVTVGSGQLSPVNNGDILFLGSLRGFSAPSLFIKVTNKSGDTFQFYSWSSGAWSGSPFDSSGTSYAKGGYINGPSCDKIYRTYTANSAATYVFGLDYSSAAPTLPGHHYIRIPGLGVSDPIWFGEDAYAGLIKCSAKGEYHERNGCALDGRFGFTRASAMRNGVNGCVIYKSKFPFIWSTQSGILTNNISVDVQYFWSNMTSNVIDAGGGIRDAGDWDGFTGENMQVCHNYLNLYDIANNLFMALDTGVPKMSELETGYTEMDSAPSLVHQAMWQLAWLLRCQDANGGVPDGMENSNQDDSGSEQSPSPQCIYVQYTGLPNHYTNYMYAMCAAMMGRVLNSLGFTTLGKTYLASAELAWAFAEDIYQHLIAPTLTLTSVTGAFAAGETVTGGSSGATATVYQNGTTSVAIYGRSGTFSAGETITGGTSGAHGAFSSLADNASFNRLYYYDTATSIRATNSFTADTTANNAQLTNVSNTSGINVGDQVIGGSIPTTTSNYALVKSIDQSGVNGKITLASYGDEYDKNGTLIKTGTSMKPTASASTVSFTSCVPGGGWNDVTYNTNIASTQTHATDSRIGAAAAIARALADPALPVSYSPTQTSAYYRGIYEALTIKTGLAFDLAGGFEYCLDPGANATIRNSVISNFRVASGSTTGLVKFSESANQSFKLLARGYPVTNQYGGSWTILAAVRWSLYFSRIYGADAFDPDRFAAMQAAIANVHGANLYGVSGTSGFGPRPCTGILHRDSQILGAAGAPDGITRFGSTGYNNCFITSGGFNIFGTLPQTCLTDVNISGETNPAMPARIVEPFTRMWPGWHVIDSRNNIGECEYGPVTWSNQLAMAAFLAGYGGNAQLTPSAEKVALQLRTN